MTNKRRTRIEIERHEVTIIRQPGKEISVYCEHCQSKVSAFTLEETKSLLCIPISEIDSHIKSGEIHFVKTTKGILPLICNGQRLEKNI